MFKYKPTYDITEAINTKNIENLQSLFEEKINSFENSEFKEKLRELKAYQMNVKYTKTVQPKQAPKQKSFLGFFNKNSKKEFNRLENIKSNNNSDKKVSKGKGKSYQSIT